MIGTDLVHEMMMRTSMHKSMIGRVKISMICSVNRVEVGSRSGVEIRRNERSWNGMISVVLRAVVVKWMGHWKWGWSRLQ